MAQSLPMDNANVALVIDIAKDRGAITTGEYAKIIAEQWDDVKYRSHVFSLIYFPTNNHNSFCTLCR